MNDLLLILRLLYKWRIDGFVLRKVFYARSDLNRNDILHFVERRLPLRDLDYFVAILYALLESFHDLPHNKVGLVQNDKPCTCRTYPHYEEYVYTFSSSSPLRIRLLLEAEYRYGYLTVATARCRVVDSYGLA